MSRYITIYKNDAPLNSWCGSSEMYAVLAQFVSGEEKEPIELSDVAESLNLLNENLQHAQQQLDRCYFAVDRVTDSKSIFDLLGDIDDLKVRLEEIEDAIVILKFIKNCIEFGSYAAEPNEWTWAKE